MRCESLARSLLGTYRVSDALLGVGTMAIDVLDKVSVPRSPQNSLGGREERWDWLPRGGLGWWEGREGFLEEVQLFSMYLLRPAICRH